MHLGKVGFILQNSCRFKVNHSFLVIFSLDFVPFGQNWKGEPPSQLLVESVTIHFLCFILQLLPVTYSNVRKKVFFFLQYFYLGYFFISSLRSILLSPGERKPSLNLPYGMFCSIISIFAIYICPGDYKFNRFSKIEMLKKILA